jgi:hypothetical protein
VTANPGKQIPVRQTAKRTEVFTLATTVSTHRGAPRQIARNEKVDLAVIGVDRPEGHPRSL